MSNRREILRLAELLASAPTVSYHEGEPFARVRAELDRVGLSYASDRWGNLLVRYRGTKPRGRPVAFSAHADHPGLVVLQCEGRRATARWLGGVARRYFRRARVRIETSNGAVRGSVVSTTLGANNRVSHVRLSLERPVPVGSIGGFDLIPFRHTPPWVRTKSADDLLGCAAVLSLLKELARSRPKIEVWGLFTRAEEDGLIGATALAQDGTLPKETAVVVLETSKELPCGRLGKGPVVRVGDRRAVYDPGICQGLHEAAEELAGRLRSFQYQRGLMDGGVCEATSFLCFGYQAAGLALPLRNYHNMGRHGIAEEVVHDDDLWNLARLLPAAATRIATASDGLSHLRKSLVGRLATVRRQLASSAVQKSRLAAMLCLLGVGVASVGVAGPGPIDDPATTRKPHPRAESVARTAEDPDPRDAYDARHYDLELSIDPMTEQIAGVLRMRLKALEPIVSVRLDLDETLLVDSTACDGVPCSFSRPGEEQIELSLPEALETGDSVDVYVRYAGTPGPPFFVGFEFFSSHGDKEDAFPIVSNLSQPDRAHGWWPCKDVMGDKATLSMTVETPEGFVVAGNGNRMREESDGERSRTTWATSYPIATYLVSFAATNYVTWSETYHAADGDSIPLLFYAYPEDETDAKIDFTATAEALAVFEDRFGPYPFRDRARGWEKLGVAEFSWSSGAMEHQTCISYGDGFVTGTHSKDWVLAHEIAHQWWGDAVTPITMDDIWLNEGFATYCEALFAEARGGMPAYRDWMKRLWRSERSEFPGTIIDPVDAFGGQTVYNKGAWVLHMLRDSIGDVPFFTALNEYLDRHRYGNSTTSDFIRAVEETVYDDLSWFFIPWLYGTGRPQLTWDWWSDPTSAGHQLQVFVGQSQDDPTYPRGTPGLSPPDHFSFPLEVRIFGQGDSVSQTVFIDERIETLTLGPIDFEPDSVALDPDEWLLRAIAPRGTGISSTSIRVCSNPTPGRTDLLVRKAHSGEARLEIFDLLGRRVQSLPTPEGSGIHKLTWDGADAGGRPVSAGVYFVRMSGSAGGPATARIVIAR